MTSRFIKASVATFALLVTAFVAEAADMRNRAPYYDGPPRPFVDYYSWAGFYAGVNGGYGFGTSTWGSSAFSPDPTGGLFGLTLGYNWQKGVIVYGLEGDYNFSMLKGSAACAATTCETENTWLATMRGRIGIALDHWMPYLTVGGAYGDIASRSLSTGLTSASSDELGWTFGVGMEYAFMGNWTAKIEYLYVDLGDFNCGAACGGVAPGNVSLTSNVFRAGLNYKFFGPILSRW